MNATIDLVHQLDPDDCYVSAERIITWAHDSLVNEAVDAHVKAHGPISDSPMGELLEGLCNSVPRPTLEDAIAHLEDVGKATFARTHGATCINRMSDVLRPVARACWPKEQHPTRGAADAQRRSLIRRGLERDLSRIHSYRCPHCHMYHVGHRG